MLFCRTQDDVFVVREQDPHTIIATHEKYWLSPLGDLHPDAPIRVIARKRILIVHNNLEIVRMGCLDPELQEAIIKLQQLDKIAAEFYEQRNKGMRKPELNIRPPYRTRKRERELHLSRY